MVESAAGAATTVAAAASALPDGRTRFVGIDGRGGAGKTTFAARLADLLDGAHVVHVDDFSAPDVDEWDWTRFREQLVLPLLSGRVARYQAWDWGRDAGGDWIDVPPGGIVIVEGVSATRTEAGVAWDLTIWVDTPVDVRRARALDRDGVDMWPVWRDRWIPSEEAYVAREHPEVRADFVVPGTL